jgi:uncharacterized protein (TIGR02268 family)
MRSPSPLILLVPVLLTSALSAQAQPAACQTAVRRIELVSGTAPPAELCISPGLSTTLLFDSALIEGAVALEGRERFRRVDVAGSLLVLVPSESLKAGERLRLEVRFTGSEAPASATFVLVVHRAEAERQVEVLHSQRPSDVCQAELQRKDVALQQCEAQLARLSEAPGESALFAKLLASGLLDKDLTQSTLKSQEVIQAPGDALRVRGIRFFRAHGRVAMNVMLVNLDRMNGWVMEGAALVGSPEQVLEAQWAEKTRLAPGEAGEIWLEVAAPAASTLARYELVLWDANKARTVTVRGVKLP